MVDLFLNISQVAFANVEHPVAKHPRGTGYLVDEVARRSRLSRRQNLAALRLFRVARRSGLFALNLDHRRGDVAQQPNRNLAVEIHVLDKPRDVRITSIDRKTDQLWVPNAPLFAALIELALRIEWVGLHRRSR